MNTNEVKPSRRLKLAASVTAALSLLSGVLLLAEHDASARSVPSVASALAAAQAAQTTVAVPQAMAATPQQLLPDTATQAQVLALGQQTANQSLAAVQAAEVTPVDPLICAILLAQRAAVVQSYNLLIAQFPQFAPAIIVERNAALAVIDAQLARFGCPVPSGVAL